MITARLTSRTLATGASVGVLALACALGCSSSSNQQEKKQTTQAPTGESTLLAVGAPAPEFTAEAHNGTSISMSALRGNPVVVYFYPKDMTAG